MTASAAQLLGVGMGVHAKPASDYFSEVQHQHLFATYRAQRYETNKVTRASDQEYWSQLDETKLVDTLWVEWFGEPYTASSWDYPDLNLDSIQPQPIRRGLKPFKINYDTFQEAKLRLGNSVIGIKGCPFLVTKVGKHSGGWILAVSDGKDTYKVKYDDITDLRSIPPMYIPGEFSGWVARTPGRVYQQGLNRHNTHIRSIDGTQAVYQFDPSVFVPAWNARRDRTWNTDYASLLESGDMRVIRLSDDVAVRSSGRHPIVCYKGRQLGKVEGNDVIVDDEDDLRQGWIETAVNKVGFEMRG